MYLIFYVHIYFRAQTSNYEPQISCESSFHQKQSNIKSGKTVELSDQLRTTMKDTSGKLQVFSTYLYRQNILVGTENFQ